MAWPAIIIVKLAHCLERTILQRHRAWLSHQPAFVYSGMLISELADFSVFMCFQGKLGNLQGAGCVCLSVSLSHLFTAVCCLRGKAHWQHLPSIWIIIASDVWVPTRLGSQPTQQWKYLSARVKKTLSVCGHSSRLGYIFPAFSLVTENFLPFVVIWKSPEKLSGPTSITCP